MLNDSADLILKWTRNLVAGLRFLDTKVARVQVPQSDHVCPSDRNFALDRSRTERSNPNRSVCNRVVIVAVDRYRVTP